MTALRRFASSRINMRILALLQIVLLLATSLVPEGRHLLSAKTQCGSDCACSAESRQAGTCCCSGKTKASDVDADTDAEPAKGCSNCKAAVAKATECCSQTKSCCKAGPRSGKSNCHQEAISACPCGSDAYELVVITMPRTGPLRVHLESPCNVEMPSTILDERCDSAISEPESPPPKAVC